MPETNQAPRLAPDGAGRIYNLRRRMLASVTLWVRTTRSTRSTSAQWASAREAAAQAMKQYFTALLTSTKDREALVASLSQAYCEIAQRAYQQGKESK